MANTTKERYIQNKKAWTPQSDYVTKQYKVGLTPGKGSFLHPTPFRLAWDSPGFKLNRQQESSPKNKSSGKETRHSNPLSAKIKNAWSFTATSPWSSA